MKVAPPTVFLLAFAFASGCKHSDPTPITPVPSLPTSKAPTSTGSEKLTKLKIEDLVVGKGNGFSGGDRPAQNGDHLYVLYTGKLADGTVFDSNEDISKQPFIVHLGEAMVIQGWDKGLVGMKAGGSRKLSIPTELGYGNAQQDKIPPGSDLYFDVKLLDIVHKGEEHIIDKREIKQGSGPVVQTGSKVTFHYTVKSLRGDTIESDKGPGVTVVIGKGQAAPSIETGMMGMHQGGIRELHLPPLAALPTSKLPQGSVQLVTLEATSVS
jgi:FKBP-type peptidyl-prolyl cis-trans isomerase